MIKHKGSVNKLINQLKVNKNNAVSFIYNESKNSMGPLSEATILLKDNYATIDAPTQASSKILENFITGYDATVVQKLKNAGAAIVGKVHCDELALGGSGLLSAYGIIKNPLDENRIVGGSSSGSAATFSKNVSISIGSDTGDSVRLPASYIGAVGFKPSYGAISRYGLFAFASSLDTVAYFAHNVSDIISTSKILYGKDEKDFSSVDVDKPINEIIKPKKVVILDWVGIPEYAKNKISILEKKLKSENIEIHHKSLSHELQELIGITYSAISFSEASSNDANLAGIVFGNKNGGNTWQEIMTNARSKYLGKMVQRRFALGSFFLLIENQKDIFLQAQKIRALINKEMTSIALSGDVVINPATTIAPLIKDQKENTPFTNHLAALNFTGQPNIVIPFGKYNNMPFGLSIFSKLYNDKALLSYSLYFESILGDSNE